MALTRWFASTALAATLGLAALAPAQAQSPDLVRTIVDIADVVMRGNQPYYRHGNYGYDDRLVAGRDRYGRTVYYRAADPRSPYGAPGYRTGYGQPYGYDRGHAQQRTRCDSAGRCRTQYYDPRYDQRRYGNRYGYDNRYRHDNRYYGYSRGERDDD